MTGERHHVENLDSDALPNHESGLSRRRLLGAAAGGCALAASGLFLPESHGDALAREGAYDGTLGGRHGKNRRGRDQRKRRTHGDKKDNRDHDQPGDINFGIEFQVELTSGRPVKVDHYRYNLGLLRWEFDDRDTLALPGGSKRTFSVEEPAAALWIDDRYLVRVINPLSGLPTAEMGYDGEFINNTSDGWRNGTSNGLQRMTVGKADLLVVNLYTIFTKRLGDDDSKRRKVFKVNISKPAA